MRNQLAIALCLLANTPVPGQDTSPAATHEAGFILDVGDHELTDIVDRAAKFLGRNYLFPAEERAMARPRGQQGAGTTRSGLTVRLQKRLVLDAIACEEVLSQLAFGRGFVIQPVDTLRGLYKVIHLRGPQASSVFARYQQLSPEEVLRKSRMRTIVSTVVQLRFIQAQNASSQLRAFFQSATLRLTAAGTNSSVLLMGLADQVATAIQILRTLDVAENATNQGHNQAAPYGYLQRQILEQHGQIKALTERISTLQRRLGDKQRARPKPTAPKAGKAPMRHHGK